MGEPREVIDVVVVGSGSAALCAAIAARSQGAETLIVEAAPWDMAGGNSRYTAGAMRFAYDGRDDLLPLLRDPNDPRLATADFGRYTADDFSVDLHGFNEGRELSREQRILIDESLPTMHWLAEQGVRFDPIWARQSFVRDGRHVFWGGLTLAAAGEGPGLVDAELEVHERLDGRIRYESPVVDLITVEGRVTGVEIEGGELIQARSVVLACGGFEAQPDLRVENLGEEWAHAKVRGTPYNVGTGLRLAWAQGAARHGIYENCHATPMDRDMPDFGNLDLPHLDRKNYRKICYFLGVMLNAAGERFVDEGANFRNYTYAQFGRAVLEQPGHTAWQIFDAKVADLLYGEYRFHGASFVEAETLDGLLALMDGIDPVRAAATLADFNAAVDESVPFNPAVLDGRCAPGLTPPRSNWAQRLDTPPFRAFPVTGGITFTYGGLHVDDDGAVLRDDGSVIEGLFACGELVGGVFFGGYPGGSGLTSGAVFGRRAGLGAAK
ncbi:MAG: FAD-dependent tricarballylate dehydrogenase TcuA [Actinomycetota bacterium]